MEINMNGNKPFYTNLILNSCPASPILTAKKKLSVLQFIISIKREQKQLINLL